MRKGFAIAVVLPLIALIAAACGNFLGLSEEEKTDGSADPDGSSTDVASGTTDGDPLNPDAPSSSNSDGSADPDADAAADAAKDVAVPPIDAGGGAIINPACASKRSRSDGGCDPLVFITKEVFNGSLPNGVGGIGPEKGDNLCNEKAGAATIVGSYRAWLSSATEGPDSDKRFPKRSTRPYRLLDGNIVANDFTELKTTGPKTAINLSQVNTTVPSNEHVWTGTVVGGTPSAFRCNNNMGSGDWGSIGNAITGTYGYADPANLSTWTNAGNGACASPGHLYCVEQQD